jgi:hypothetical protein
MELMRRIEWAASVFRVCASSCRSIGLKLETAEDTVAFLLNGTSCPVLSREELAISDDEAFRRMLTAKWLQWRAEHRSLLPPKRQAPLRERVRRQSDNSRRWTGIRSYGR